MGSDSTLTEDESIHDLTDEYKELNNGNNQEVIVVDGRRYENNADNKKQIFNLVDIIENTQTADNVHEDVMKRVVETVERITREMVPEIAERVIKEEIEKLKKISATE
jgi:ketopantoate hydroxymethyltransferase